MPSPIPHLFRSIYTDPVGYESTDQLPSSDEVEAVLAELEQLIAQHQEQNDFSSHPKLPERWYQDEVLYILYADLFHQDFAGLTKKLDQLQELGVTLIHALPCFTSPDRDKGFDVSDYYTIQQSLGGNQAFAQFVTQAHRRGFKVMIDLILNHTSDQHPWAQAAVKNPHAPERDYYYFHHGVPQDLYRYEQKEDGSQEPLFIVFSDFYGEEKVKGLKDEPGNPRYVGNWVLVGYEQDQPLYVYSTFYEHQWDTNSRSPRLLLEMIKVMLFWRKRGVDMFRLDAILFWWKKNFTSNVHQPKLLDILQLLREINDVTYPGTTFLGEISASPKILEGYFGDEKNPRIPLNYDFPLQHDLWHAAMSQSTERLRTHLHTMGKFQQQHPEAALVLFDESHDELNAEHDPELEQLLREKIIQTGLATPFKEGIAGRRVELLEHHLDRLLLMEVCKFTLPGVPAVYYGNEVGMGSTDDYMQQRHQEELDKRRTSHPELSEEELQAQVPPDTRDRKRGPIDWDWYQQQKADPNSLGSQIFTHLQQLIQLRVQHPALRHGTINLIPVQPQEVLAYTRQYQSEMVLIIQNWSDRKLTISTEELSLGENSSKALFGQAEVGEGKLVLQPYQSLIWGN